MNKNKIMKILFKKSKVNIKLFKKNYIIYFSNKKLLLNFII